MSDAVAVALTPEEALASLGLGMIDAAAARSWVLRRVSPSGAVCPVCGSRALPGSQEQAWIADGRVRCKGCGKWYTNRTGTAFEGCALGWAQLYLLLVLLAAGCTPEEIAGRLDVHPRTVHRMQQRMVAP